MWVSIVIAVLDSHRIVHRQLLHFAKMELPDTVEIILVDDGSDPALTDTVGFKNLRIIPTYNYCQTWSQAAARNLGVEMAYGEYIIATDIDHIITRAMITQALATSYDVLRYKREVAVLTEDGVITQNTDLLAEYGYHRPKKRVSAHGNSYAIKRELFRGLGGSRQGSKYPLRDEIPLKRAIKSLQRQEKVSVIPDKERETIYLIPNGRFCNDGNDCNFNPGGLFHGLKR